MATASPAVTVSTADVPPRYRFFDSDRVQSVVFASDSEAADTQDLAWVPLRRVQIVEVIIANGDVAMATATNTTAVDVDIQANGGTKAHDVCAKAAATALAANTYSSLTLATAVAATICEATEQVAVSIVKAGTQGACTVTINYIDLAVSDESADWTA